MPGSLIFTIRAEMAFLRQRFTTPRAPEALWTQSFTRLLAIINKAVLVSPTAFITCLPEIRTKLIALLTLREVA